MRVTLFGMSKISNDKQNPNAPLPIVVTLLGI